MIIDGVDLEYDWLNDDNLFGELIDLPPNSVFWFSAPNQLGENASILAEQGILITDSEGFYDNLVHHMPELLQSQEKENFGLDIDDTLYTSLTLRFSDKHIRTVHIRRSDISDITGGNLCVIDDDILEGGLPSEKSRSQSFADFLTQDGLPSWYLFNKKGKEQSFYIKRDQDQVLEDRVYGALKENGVVRKPIILCGPSNSGKSMMLANLALILASRRKYPVIFIRGEMVTGAESRLEKFIDNWFCDPDRFGGERPNKVLVIWDGSGLKQTEQDYMSLQKLLFHRNAQVVGSTYVARGDQAIILKQSLSDKEEQQLRNVLISLDGDYYTERFDEIKKNSKMVQTLKNSSLLYLLQTLFKYEFDAEYRSLAEILARQFNQEEIYAVRHIRDSLHTYVEQLFQAQQVRARYGVASSFQEKLEVILQRMKEEQREKKAVSISQDDENHEKLKKLQEFSRCITDINNILAVASEFGVQLPLNLLLRFLRDQSSVSYVAYGEESAKIIEILRADTLIDFTYKSNPYLGEEYYVSFRNSIEAENYLCLLCNLPLEDHSNKRKEKEVEILIRIIKMAETEIEVRSVVELVRQFGPNGHGMLSELDNYYKRKDYLQYKEYWLKIAKTMMDMNPDDPEVVLLCSHLTREYIIREEPANQVHYIELYNQARTRLETALQHLQSEGQDESAQYNRLSVELCANYQQTLRTSFNMVIYDSIKKRVREAFRVSKYRNTMDFRKDFSSNYMLDILLNAYNEYRKEMAQQGISQLDDELAEILCDIDNMFNLDDLLLERQNNELIRKVHDVYALLGNSAAQLEQLGEKLIKLNSDALLYLQARMLWQNSDMTSMLQSAKEHMNFLYADHYMVICHDIPYAEIKVPQVLLERTAQDAKNVVEFLETHEDIIKNTKSERCIAMMLRAKWFLITGNPMLEEKQQAALSRAQWDELNALCDRYHSYHDVKLYEPCIPAYFFKGVYEWVYGDISRAKKWFERAKYSARGDVQVRTVERLALCVEESTTPRTFMLLVKRGERRKYTASIIRETTEKRNGKDMVVTRYGMVVSDNVAKYLFDGTMPREQCQQAKKDGVIRFNLIGAQIGIPQHGGITHES